MEIYKIEMADKLKTMEAGKFQLFVKDALSKEYEFVALTGGQQGTNKTSKGHPDILFKSQNRKYIFIEATTCAKNSVVKKFKKDIDSCIQKINEDNIECEKLILAYNKELGTKQISELENYKNNEKQFKLEYCGAIKLIDCFVSNRSNSELLEIYFNIPYTQEMFTSRGKFIELFNRDLSKIKINRKLIGREKETKEVLESLTENKFTVIEGYQGVGKTELAINILKKSDSDIYYFNSNIGLNKNKLHLYFKIKKSYIVFVDDLNIANLKDFVNLVKKQFVDVEIKILATVRNSYLSTLKEEFDKQEYIPEFFSLRNNSIEETKKILSEKYSNINLVNKAIKLSNNNTRFSFMALAVMTDDTEKNFKTMLDVFELYFLKYNIYDNKNEALILLIVFILSKGRKMNIKKIFEIFQKFNIEENDYTTYLKKLNKEEIIDYNKYFINVKDQSLQTFFIYKVLFGDFPVLLGEILKKTFIENYKIIMIKLDETSDLFENNTKKIEEIIKKQVSSLIEVEKDEKLLEKLLLNFYYVDTTKSLRFINKTISINKFDEYVLNNDIFYTLGEIFDQCPEQRKMCIELFIKCYQKIEYKERLIAIIKQKFSNLLKFTEEFKSKDLKNIISFMKSKIKEENDSSLDRLLLDVTSVLIKSNFKYEKKINNRLYTEYDDVGYHETLLLRDYLMEFLIEMYKKSPSRDKVLKLIRYYSLYERSQGNLTFLQYDYNIFEEYIIKSFEDNKISEVYYWLDFLLICGIKYVSDEKLKSNVYLNIHHFATTDEYRFKFNKDHNPKLEQLNNYLNNLTNDETICYINYFLKNIKIINEYKLSLTNDRDRICSNFEYYVVKGLKCFSFNENQIKFLVSEMQILDYKNHRVYGDLIGKLKLIINENDFSNFYGNLKLNESKYGFLKWCSLNEITNKYYDDYLRCLKNVGNIRVKDSKIVEELSKDENLISKIILELTNECVNNIYLIDELISLNESVEKKLQEKNLYKFYEITIVKTMKYLQINPKARIKELASNDKKFNKNLFKIEKEYNMKYYGCFYNEHCLYELDYFNAKLLNEYVEYVIKIYENKHFLNKNTIIFLLNCNSNDANVKENYNKIIDEYIKKYLIVNKKVFLKIINEISFEHYLLREKIILEYLLINNNLNVQDLIYLGPNSRSGSYNGTMYAQDIKMWNSILEKLPKELKYLEIIDVIKTLVKEYEKGKYDFYT